MAFPKLRLKSRKITPSSQCRVDVRRLQDASVAQEYKRELLESLGELNDSDDPEKLWTDSKAKIVKVIVQELSDQGYSEHYREESQS